MFTSRFLIYTLPSLLLSTSAQARLHTSLTTSELIPFLPPTTTTTTTTYDFSTIPKVKVWFSSPTTPSTFTRSYEFDVDTGTCGILIGSSAMQSWNETDCIGIMGEAYQYLSSSHILYTGCWVDRNVWFNRLDTGTGNQKVQARVPILVVTKEITCPGSRIGIDGYNCPSPSSVIMNPDPPRMMGIGFGRTADGQPEGTPDKNPLLNVVAIRDAAVDVSTGYGTYHPGYIISKEGLQVGLTASNYDSAGFGSREGALSLSVSTCAGSSTPAHLCQRNELAGCLSVDNVPSPCLPVTVLPTHDDPTDDSTTKVRITCEGV
ncbi:hypothetical protein B0J14DRAFT_604624 [Halenospora varia]|nr:hypothetical protein B0J14DRAFT_604624 [Halenospora varia]